MKTTRFVKLAALMLALVMLLGACSPAASTPSNEPDASAPADNSAAPSAAEPWKPDGNTITIRVANAAGGQADLIMRKVAEHVQAETGVTCVVQNITGASGFVMATDLNSYDPSICELMLGTEALFAIAPLFNKDINISLDDYVALYGTDSTTAPSTLAVPARLGVNTWEEFLEYAKNNRILAASNQPGGLTHMNVSALFGAAGIEFTSVTDSGGNKNVLSCLNGDANCVMVNTSVLHDYAEKGELIPLVQFNSTPYTDWDLDPIPSVVDLGYDIALESCNMLCCRKGVDQADVDALSKMIVDYLNSEQGIQDMAEINTIVRTLDGQTAHDRLKQEVETVSKLYDAYY